MKHVANTTRNWLMGEEWYGRHARNGRTVTTDTSVVGHASQVLSDVETGKVKRYRSSGRMVSPSVRLCGRPSASWNIAFGATPMRCRSVAVRSAGVYASVTGTPP